MNEALLAKYLWKVVVNSKFQWVQLVKSKYIPRSKLWNSKMVYNCTVFWRAIMHLRSELLPNVIVKLGDGTNCFVFGDPWFPGATERVSPSSQYNNMHVSELFSQELGGWNAELLISLFGYADCFRIMSLLRVSCNTDRNDTLIFSPSQSGVFSVKKMYQQLVGPATAGANQDGRMWEGVWKKGTVMPRVRVFLWRLLNKGLPLTHTLAHRGIAIEDRCSTCEEEHEDEMHLLFSYSFARSCWFGSHFPLRTNRLQGGIKEVLSLLLDNTSEEQWTACANIMWAIWRCRNDMICNAKLASEQKFRIFLQSIQSESTLAKVRPVPLQSDTSEASHTNINYVCFVDGSWLSEWSGGIGFIISRGSQLVVYHLAAVSVCTPMQAEARALLDVTQKTLQLGLISCTFYTDNLQLTKVVSMLQPLLEVD